MKKIIIDGNNFSNFNGFTREFSSQVGLSEGFTSLDWFDDVLYGGVVYFDEAEEVEFIWKNASKSQHDLDKEAARLLSKDDVEKYNGLFELIVDIIKNHQNVNLSLL